MLFAATANLHSDEKATTTNFEYINFTHSNFNFDKASQPLSEENFGYLNNPAYPKKIQECGFRYYPSNDLEKIEFENKKVNSLPIYLPPLSTKKIVSKKKIPSRIVSSNWVRWQKFHYFDCSTGTFIIEYTKGKSFWHWGLLNPSNKFESIISLLNPFSSEDSHHSFELILTGEQGLIKKKNFLLKGKNTQFISLKITLIKIVNLYGMQYLDKGLELLTYLQQYTFQTLVMDQLNILTKNLY